MQGDPGSSRLPLALAAGAATTIGLSAVLAANKSRSASPDDYYQLVVFLDSPTTGCSRNGKLILHPKQQPLSILQAAVCAALQLERATLFLWDTKEMLTSPVQQQLNQHIRNSSSWRRSNVIPVIANESGQLSTDAASLSPINQPRYGPKPLPVVGNALTATKGPYDAPLYNFWYNLFRPELIEKWGETVSIMLPMTPDQLKMLEGHTDDPQALLVNIQTCDPDVLGELLDRQDDFPKTWNRPAELALTKLGKGGIFTSSTESEDWQTIHGLFPRGFNQIKIQNSYFPIIMKKTNIFLEAWARYPGGHLVTGVNDWLACMTADAVIKAACNVDMDNIVRRARGEPVHPILETYRQIGRISPATAKPWEVVGWSNYLNPFYDTAAGRERKFEELKGALQEMVADLVEQTRMGGLGDSLLASLINDKSPTTGLYVRQNVLFGQFVNLLVAGHETTANTMGFLMYYLSQNPKWEERIREEVRTLLGDRSELSTADIPKLVITEACFRETLRLHPPAGQVGRDAKYDTVVKDRYLIRRGQRIVINLVALHRNPNHWGGKFGDPLTWNPERFMPGTAEASGRHPHAFKPFGFGMRSCVGMQFALWEAKTLIPMLYHNFTFKLVDKFKLYPSRKESFPSPSAQGLAFHIHPAPGAPTPAWKSQAFLNGSSSSSMPVTPEPTAAADATPVANGHQMSSNGDAKDPARHSTPLMVLYGSNSGTCEAFAAQVADSAAAAGFKVSVATLDTCCRDGALLLPKEGAVLVVTSTYNGLPPDNAAKLGKCLTSPSAAAAAAGVPYAVLGVGNSQWVTYQAFPRLVDSSLSAAGGVQLSGVFECDTEAPGFTEAAANWWDKIRPSLLGHFKLEVSEEPSVASTIARQHRLLITPATDSNTKPLHIREVLDKLKAMQAAAAAQDGKSNAAAAAAADGAVDGDLVGHKQKDQGFMYRALKIVGAEQLQGEGTGRFTRHVELELPEGMTYTAGDHLEVLPCNSPALVTTALNLLNLTGSEVYLWTPNPQGAARGFNIPNPNNSTSNISNGYANRTATENGAVIEVEALPLASKDILAWFVDLSTVPDRRTLTQLAEMCVCPPEAAALKKLAADDVYAEKVSAPKLTLLEILNQHKSLLSTLNLPALCTLLPKLAPRYYSISSSPLATAAAGGEGEGGEGPLRACITVGLVDFETKTGRQHQGAASGLVHRQEIGLYLAGTVRSLQSRFRLPVEPKTPIVMIGPGTGVAPMIGFLEEREAQQKAGVELGPSVLFFGCRGSGDYLYRSRLEGWKESGVLSDLQVAFSREPGQKKVYVQDLIASSGSELWPLLSEQGAHVYVCGDARKMAPDVRAVFVQLAQQYGGMSAEAAEKWMADMRERGRYLEDVWAS